MKRSEMRTIIQALLLKHRDCCNAPSLAELILMTQEELGMLPPMKPIPDFQFQAPNEWEPEGEKNEVS